MGIGKVQHAGIEPCAPKNRGAQENKMGIVHAWNRSEVQGAFKMLPFWFWKIKGEE